MSDEKVFYKDDYIAPKIIRYVSRFILKVHVHIKSWFREEPAPAVLEARETTIGRMGSVSMIRRETNNRKCRLPGKLTFFKNMMEEGFRCAILRFISAKDSIYCVKNLVYCANLLVY